MTIPAADTFLDHFGISPRRRDRDLVHQLGNAFRALPYENLTKLVKKHLHPAGQSRRRLPAEVVSDHMERGAGGTCFALTELFAGVLHRVGYSSFPVLCHTRHRRNGHCALVVVINEERYLVDPGFLLHEPIRLPHIGTEARPSPAVRLVGAEHGSGTVELFTYDRWRYRFELEPVPRPHFLSVWDESFSWTMMNGVHVCTAIDRGYAYLHGAKLCLRGHGSRGNLNIRGKEAEVLGERFGLDPGLVARAFELVSRERAARNRAVPIGSEP